MIVIEELVVQYSITCVHTDAAPASVNQHVSSEGPLQLSTDSVETVDWHFAHCPTMGLAGGSCHFPCFHPADSSSRVSWLSLHPTDRVVAVMDLPEAAGL